MGGKGRGDAGFEVLEHTADIGIRAWGRSDAEAFEQAAAGLVELLGARAMGPGEARALSASGRDPGGVLVDFLNEMLVLHETEGVGVAAVRIDRLSDTGLEATVEVVPLRAPPEGIEVKAATYHQLRVDRDPERTLVEVYLDV